MTAQKLDVPAFAVACGLTWGLGLLVLGLMAWLADWATPLVRVLGSLYIGFGPTLVGSLIGSAWALIDGLIYGALLALFYNWTMKRRRGA